MSVADSVPAELLDYIIRNLVPPPTEVYDRTKLSWDLHTDKRDLASVALVSRTWRACALPYLFREIAIHHHPDYVTDTSGVLRGLEYLLRGKKTVRSLLEFLHLHPTICSYVERLSLQPMLNCPAEMRAYMLDWNAYMTNLVIDSKLLVGIIKCLPRLRILTMVDLELTPFPREHANVDTLYLGLCYKSHDLIKDLSCFTSIKNLHVIVPNGHTILGSNVIPAKTMRSFSVESFSIEGDVQLPLFANLFSSSQCLHTLQSSMRGIEDMAKLYVQDPSPIRQPLRRLDTSPSS